MKSWKDEILIKSENLASWALDSDRNVTFNLPLRVGTYEHLSEQEQFEVATFLRLKGLRSPHTLRLYSRQFNTSFFCLHGQLLLMVKDEKLYIMRTCWF